MPDSDLPVQKPWSECNSDEREAHLSAAIDYLSTPSSCTGKLPPLRQGYIRFDIPKSTLGNCFRKRTQSARDAQVSRQLASPEEEQVLADFALTLAD
jgi:hypothetical protein